MKHAVHIRSTPETARPRPALRLIKTKDLPRDDWLDVRRNGIGSSDAAAAVGLNPYKSMLELWMEKTGREAALPQVDPNDEESPMYWGNILEPIVAAHYTKRTGNRVRRINAVLQHPEQPWMLANIDREVIGASDVQILECKTAGINGAKLWRDGVPEYVQLQVQHQLGVTGKKAADVAVLLGGQSLEIHRLVRDETVIARLMQLQAVFWQYVESDTPPPADGSESADLALRCLYPKDSGLSVDFTKDRRLSAMYTDLIHVREQLAKSAEVESHLKQSIQQAMGTATRALFETGSVTWKQSRDSSVLDVKALTRDHPALVQRYTDAKPGSRRFLMG